jgi:hypothetical protein
MLILNFIIRLQQLYFLIFLKRNSFFYLIFFVIISTHSFYVRHLYRNFQQAKSILSESTFL